jgi:hypothetical protein
MVRATDHTRIATTKRGRTSHFVEKPRRGLGMPSATLLIPEVNLEEKSVVYHFETPALLIDNITE